MKEGVRPMTDIQEFRNKLHTGIGLNDIEHLERYLRDIVNRNQNPGCGGDGSMTVAQWNTMRDICNHLKGIQNCVNILTYGGPLIKDSACWVQNHEG